jgi:hypothetical protein
MKKMRWLARGERGMAEKGLPTKTYLTFSKINQ